MAFTDMDSLDRTTLTLLIEDEFNIEWEDKDFTSIVSFRSAVDKVLSHENAI